MEVLYNVLRKTSFCEDFRDMFDDCRCLWRGFEDYCVSSQESWYERVHQDQIRILDSLAGLLAYQQMPLTFQANRTRTGPTGIFLMNLLKPFSASPSVSFNASSLIFRRCSPLITAVVTSFAV